LLGTRPSLFWFANRNEREQQQQELENRLFYGDLEPKERLDAGTKLLKQSPM
jgi:hypothetical protein